MAPRSLARLGLALLAPSTLLQLADEPSAYASILAVLATAAAVLGVLQLDHDDLLGWTVAAGAAVVAGALLVATRSGTLPGTTSGGWSVVDLAGLLGAVLVLGATAAAARRRQPAGAGRP